jgi:hypothetical protein
VSVLLDQVRRFVRKDHTVAEHLANQSVGARRLRRECNATTRYIVEAIAAGDAGKRIVDQTVALHLAVRR